MSGNHKFKPFPSEITWNIFLYFYERSPIDKELLYYNLMKNFDIDRAQIDASLIELKNDLLLNEILFDQYQESPSHSQIQITEKGISTLKDLIYEKKVDYSHQVLIYLHKVKDSLHHEIREYLWKDAQPDSKKNRSELSRVLGGLEKDRLVYSNFIKPSEFNGSRKEAHITELGEFLVTKLGQSYLELTKDEVNILNLLDSCTKEEKDKEIRILELTNLLTPPQRQELIKYLSTKVRPA